MEPLSVQHLKDEIPAAVGVRWKYPAAAVAGTALVAICAHIALPLGFTPVPVTMQTFAVLLLGLLLPPGAAFASLVLYLIEGACGLPVFTPAGPGGLAQLLGPTAGYLLSCPAAAALSSVISRRLGGSLRGNLAATGVAGFLILASGGAWLGFVGHAPFRLVFAQSVAPFLPGDALKMIAAVACASVFRSFRSHRTERE